MSDLPMPSSSSTSRSLVGTHPQPAPNQDFESSQVSEVWGIVTRHWWLIASAALVCALLAVVYVTVATPVYRAGTTVRVDDKQPNLPEVFRSLAPPAIALATEMQVLNSRTLLEEAIRELSLQVRLLEPRRVRRSEILQRVHVSADARPGTYRLRAVPGGIRVEDLDSGMPVIEAGITEPVRFNGVSFTIPAEALQHGEIRLAVLPFEETVHLMSEAIEVERPGREASVVTVSYTDADPELVYQVPNTIVSRFIARGQDARKTEARSTVVFLRRQLDTLASQLGTAENDLRRFRERERVVNPEIEASTQLSRLVEMQSQRGLLEAERAALAQLVDQLDRQGGRGGKHSPHRDLLAFPTLLRNQASSDLLQALSTVEEQRTELLARRTPEDPDVKALDQRIAEIESELRTFATSYLQGLSNQVGTLDSVLGTFSRQLDQVPRKELEFARLERQPKVLEDIYALLQTRLKEAEIAEAVEDPSIRVVDLAVAPLMPLRPRKAQTVAGAAIFGLLLGLTGAFLRDRLDRSVHSHSDIFAATGLPVLGLVPRLPDPSKMRSMRMITPSAPINVTPPRAPKGSGRHYTFLSDPEEPGISPPPAPEQPIRQVSLASMGAQWAEAYRSLQTNLVYASPEAPPGVVVLTSALPQEGKTTTAVNLALILAERGIRVVLIDADLRRGTVHRAFQHTRGPGLAQVLAGTTTLDDVMRVVPVEGGVPLHFVPCGEEPVNPPGLLESSTMQAILARVRQEYSVVLIDTPPVNILTDAAILAGVADGVLLVARAGVTQGPALHYALNRLNHVRARIYGVVLNDLDFKRDAAYDPTYRYYQYNPYTGTATE